MGYKDAKSAQKTKTKKHTPQNQRLIFARFLNIKLAKAGKTVLCNKNLYEVEVTFNF